MLKIEALGGSIIQQIPEFQKNLFPCVNMRTKAWNEMQRIQKEVVDIPLERSKVRTNRQ